MDVDVSLVLGFVTLDYGIVDCLYIIVDYLYIIVDYLYIIVDYLYIIVDYYISLWIIITAAEMDGWAPVSHPEERRRRKVRTLVVNKLSALSYSDLCMCQHNLKKPKVR
jgi:hypothetical protein